MASRRPPSNSAPRLDLKTKLQNAAQDIIGKGEISGNSVDKLIQLFLEERGGWSTRGHEADIQIVETKIQTNTETGTVYTLLPHSTSPNVKYATWYLQPGDVSPVRLTSASDRLLRVKRDLAVKDLYCASIDSSVGVSVVFFCCLTLKGQHIIW
jgi:hypothetical protein